MKILHTADWHIGRTLYGRKRYDEFSAFLEWLLQTIIDQQIYVLLVAGDIFDTSTPSNKAQELYYNFLADVAKTDCKHVVVIGGNHDSPSFLNAPKTILQKFKVYVVGAKTEKSEEEVIELKTGEKPELLVCAVPYLRDKDIRTVEAGETIDTKNAKLVEGLKNHYAEVCAIAEQKQTAYLEAGHEYVPIVAMGHLFTAGGITVEGDGVRELYVGSLAHVEADVFPASIDYLALGHLHVPQKVGNAEHIRYCGSPIPMGFGEANQEKKVLLIEFNGKKPFIQELPIPCFQKLVRIAGPLEQIIDKLNELKQSKSSAWLEIEYTGSEVVTNLRELIEEIITDSEMEVRRIKNRRIIDRVINSVVKEETLDDLGPNDVFQRCLDAHEIPDEERADLTLSYREIISSMEETDINAE